MSLPTIAFIGGGNMATAIIDALLAGNCPPAIRVCDPVAAIRERHAAKGCAVSVDPAATIAGAGVVLLAVKPQAIGEVLPALAPLLGGEPLVISILAGTRCARLEAGLGAEARVVRAMPNTPMAIGKGMVGLCPGRRATAADLDLAEAIFSGAAAVLRCDEGRMDAITAVSGSGPAYLFHFCEALQAAAIGLGFSAEEAALLVGQTVEGSIAYLRSQEGFPAARLREQVTSPGGTTAAALAVFKQAGFEAMVAQALAAAEARGRELSG
jgi:pyrroline-5-carboxylate reductase